MNLRGRAFPLHIGGPLHRSIHCGEDGTIPVVFKSSPASLNRTICTMVSRIIDQYNTQTCLMAKFKHSSDKLCAMTLHRGTIIQIDSEFLHVRMLMSIVMPPRLQTIHNKVRRLMGLTKKDRQCVP